MGTIREIFKSNVERLRAGRAIKAISADTKIPYRTMRNIEDRGVIPHEATLARLAQYYGVEESKLFADPEYVATPEEALEVLKKAVERAKALESLSPSQRQLLDLLPSLKEGQVRLILDTVKKTVGIGYEMERKGKKA